MNPPAPTEIPKQPAELAEQLAQYNSDIAALQLMVDGEVEVVDYTSDEQHNYTLELSDGKIVNAALQQKPILISQLLRLMRMDIGNISWEVKNRH